MCAFQFIGKHNVVKKDATFPKLWVLQRLKHQK